MPRVLQRPWVFPVKSLHSGEVLPFAGWEDLPVPFPEPVLDPYADLSLSYHRLIAREVTRRAHPAAVGTKFCACKPWPYLRFLYKRQRFAFGNFHRWADT